MQGGGAGEGRDKGSRRSVQGEGRRNDGGVKAYLRRRVLMEDDSQARALELLVEADLAHALGLDGAARRNPKRLLDFGHLLRVVLAQRRQLARTDGELQLLGQILQLALLLRVGVHRRGDGLVLTHLSEGRARGGVERRRLEGSVCVPNARATALMHA